MRQARVQNSRRLRAMRDEASQLSEGCCWKSSTPVSNDDDCNQPLQTARRHTYKAAGKQQAESLGGRELARRSAQPRQRQHQQGGRMITVASQLGATALPSHCSHSSFAPIHHIFNPCARRRVRLPDKVRRRAPRRIEREAQREHSFMAPHYYSSTHRCQPAHTPSIHSAYDIACDTCC